MKKVRIGINGFGRIGRAFFRLAQGEKNIEIVGINDLGSPESAAYLLTYDSVYGQAPFSVAVEGNTLVVDGKSVRLLSEKDPAALPWGDLGVDVVIESTGAFTSYEKARAHIEAGAQRVVISAPSKDEDGEAGATILMGLNDDKLKNCTVSSNASCTTNAGSPLIAILDEGIGIEKAVLNTVHGYTASQALIDGSSKKDLREGRAAAINIIPSSTGAAVATTRAYEALTHKFDGVSVRVPVPVGSLVDVTFISKKETSVDEVNAILRAAAHEERWKDIFTATDEPIVSSDIIGNTHASIADLSFTKVVDGNLVKVFAWYDNEMGYSKTLLLHAIKTAQYL